MQRFFVSFPLEESITVSDEKFHHQFTRVLRAQVGDRCIFFNGSGEDFVYRVQNITKKEISFLQEEIISKKGAKGSQVTLLQALPNKIEKIEYILQKGVEVGIDVFVFFPSDRSQPLALLERKKERLIDIAREALEQSGGDTLPEIRFELQIPQKGAIPRIITDTRSGYIPLGGLEKNESYEICIGPEGGWSDSEIVQFIQDGSIGVSLGNRILRTETAGVVTAFFLKNR